jgi:hypothetical protein
MNFSPEQQIASRRHEAHIPMGILTGAEWSDHSRRS